MVPKPGASADGREGFASDRPRERGKWAGKAKGLIRTGGILLLVVAAVGLYTSVKEYLAIRPADSYEDSGVHTFVPYDILPVQVKNNGFGRYQRMNPTRIVYKVYYRTNDGTGYQWRVEGGSARALAEQIYGRGPVERRVLSIPADNTYITVEVNQDAESYTAGLRQRYLLILGVCAGYVVIYLAVWVIRWARKQAEKVALE